VRSIIIPLPLALTSLLAVACDPSPAPATAPASVSASVSASASATAPASVSASVSASASAPDATTHASEVYEPGPSVLAEDSIDGAALRKRHIERLKHDTSPVTVLKGESPLELGKRICEAVVPRRPAATPVLLKPNICGFDSIKDP